MIKGKMELDLDADAFVEEISTAINASIQASSEPLKGFLKDQAANSLTGSLPLWNRGLKVEAIDDDSYMIVLDGKLSNMIEDGFSGSELKRILLEGARASYNQAQSPNGTRYVDVPFGIPKENIERGKVAGINLSQFKDAASITKHFTQTKNNHIGPASAKTKRVHDVIQSYGKDSKVGFMTIRRVSEKSQLKGWSGAKILDQSAEIERFISAQFDVNFTRLL